MLIDQCRMPTETNAFSTKMTQKESVKGSGRDITRGPEKNSRGQEERDVREGEEKEYVDGAYTVGMGTWT